MARSPKKKKDPYAAYFTRRSVLLFGAQTAIAGGLAARMYQLQILEGDEYRQLAEKSRIKPTLIAPTRGRILARDGTPLAENRPNYQLVLYREQTDDVAKTLKRLAGLTGLSQSEIENLTEQANRMLEFMPLVVAENLDWETFASVNANAPALPGIEPQIGLTRYYPEGDRAAHLVGYVSAATKEDIEREADVAKLLRLPGIRVGRTGVERIEESYLRGSAGVVREERDVRGRPIRELERNEGSEGQDLKLTLNLDLQNYALRRLGEEAGSVVVMDIYEGDVLALASSPSFDPNGFVIGLSDDDWRALNTHEHRPLNNKGVSGLYPPGSTFKMLVALAALDEGVVPSGHSVNCTGHIQLGRRKFHCWKRGGHGTVDMHDALKESCDIYFYDLAKRLGIDRIAETAARFGIGELPEIGLPDARKGLMPTQDWKRRAKKEPWQGGETLIAGIGQGYIQTTPLQLAQMTATIANGGFKVHPRLIKERAGKEVKSRSLLGTGISESNVEVVRRAMDAVVNEQGGTAYGSRITAPRFRMAGKTGTAQVRTISLEERLEGVRKNEDLPWKLRDHALFVAFAPADNPRHAVAVVVEHGGGGSKVAAPIARDVLLQLYYPDELPKDAIPAGAKPVFRLPPENEDEGEES